MNEYRKLNCRFWIDEQIQQFPPTDKLVAIYIAASELDRVLCAFGRNDGGGLRLTF